MRIGQLGNFSAPHSTENHLKIALEANGHRVDPYQESERSKWSELTKNLDRYNFVLWTRTGWDPPIPHGLQRRMLAMADRANVPVIGYHLDRWWGLDREGQVRSEPFFEADIVVTADGGHEQEFEDAGVNHVWFPPGVSAHECLRTPNDRPEFKHDLIFVGSWLHYHPEWKHRFALVEHLRSLGAMFYPQENTPAVRGQDLVDLYYNAKIAVGDSCLVGDATHYWSDRIPETLGRGGFLIHPNVEGLEQHYTPGKHLVTFDLWDFDTLTDQIQHYLTAEDERKQIAEVGRSHTLLHHTYEVRMKELIDGLFADYLKGS